MAATAFACGTAASLNLEKVLVVRAPDGRGHYLGELVPADNALFRVGAENGSTVPVRLLNSEVDGKDEFGVV